MRHRAGVTGFPILFLLIAFLPVLALPVQGEAFSILKGDQADILLDRDGGRAWYDGAWHPLPKSLEATAGLLARTEAGWWAWDRDGLRLPGSPGRVIPATDVLLPVVGPGPGLQSFVAGKGLVLPVVGGWWRMGPDGTGRRIHWQWQVESHGVLDVTVPDVRLVAGRLFVLTGQGLMCERDGGWTSLAQLDPVHTVGAVMLALDRRVVLVTQDVTPGELGSFRVRVRVLDAVTMKPVLDRDWPGIMKDPFTDGHRQVVFEYVKASLFAALFDRRKMRIRSVDVNTGEDRTVTVSLGDKRRHVYPVFSRDGRFLLLVQCKNGEVVLVDPGSGIRGKLGRPFNYDYEFVRGKGNGAFVDRLHHRVDLVDFREFR